MSTITPPSFLDDGVSIKDRLPQGLDTQRVARWVSRGTFSETSTYTGSFVDDDEDMVLRVGSIADRQSRYENEEARKNKGGEHVWNENAKKAVSGDVRRHIDKIRDLRGKVQVRKVKEMNKEKEKVLVPVPRRWGTFVIKEKDGRVVVVDDEGEFDSGPQEVYDGGKQHERRWVRAASTIESLSPLPLAPSTVWPPPDQHMGAGGFTEGAETAKKGREKDMWNYIPNSPRPLSPIPESDDEDGSSSTSKESIRSQTDFMAAVTNWRDDSQASTTGHNRSSRGSITEDRGWISPSKLPHPFTWATSPSSNISKRWNRGPKAADDPEWTDSETSSFQQDGFDGPAQSFGEATWDGFERHKTRKVCEAIIVQPCHVGAARLGKKYALIISMAGNSGAAEQAIADTRVAPTRITRRIEMQIGAKPPLVWLRTSLHRWSAGSESLSDFLCGVADWRGRGTAMRDGHVAITTRVRNGNLGIFVEMESRKFFLGA